MAGLFVVLGDGRTAYVSVFHRGRRSVAPPTEPPAPLSEPRIAEPRRTGVPPFPPMGPEIFLVVPPGPQLTSEEVSDLRLNHEVVIEVDIADLPPAPHLTLNVGRFTQEIAPVIPRGAGHFRLAPSLEWSDLDALGISIEMPTAEPDDV